jgi:hypothetical protein
MSEQGASQLKGIVSEFLVGVGIHHLNPVLLLSRDDMKVYIFEGTDTTSGQSTWRLTDTTSVAENRTHGIYETGESQGNVCGMRVTLIVTLNATCQIVDLFVVVSGP